ncbi:hypothetical protein [Clostridium intestinale]|uniref:Uncharacterized protein n=1 Tax=Clostridium intestinale URNW TaxID=1294142 RepID=U2N875_9CLOT|nr:hypothetical protein [Clostridium intestinale]ERK31722.1 hypothetical protein CINTURNW_0771 [Clostridium intestinale URNW]
MEVSLLELFARGIPEGVLFIFASYIFSRKKFNSKRVLVSIFLVALSGYLTRKLPIQPGVNSILNIFILVAINNNINKIEMIKSIRVSVIIFILQFICEAANIFLLQYLFGIDLNYVFSNSYLKTVYGIPSLFIAAVFVGVYYYVLSRKKEG